MSHFQGFFKGNVKHPITVPNTQETLRGTQTN